MKDKSDTLKTLEQKLSNMRKKIEQIHIFDNNIENTDGLDENELRNETEKTESAENEEQISEDTEPSKDESTSEVIVEEPSKDESTSEVIVEESSATTKLQD